MSVIIPISSNSDIIILAVKPNMYSKVLDELWNHVGDKILLSIAAGVPSIIKIKLEISASNKDNAEYLLVGEGVLPCDIS